MKKLFILLTILFFMNCENSSEEKRSKNFGNLYYLLIWDRYYNFYNSCLTPTSTIFSSGQYDFFLKKDEALYFDIYPRLNADSPFTRLTYFIGISKNISTADIAMNQLPTSCPSNKNQNQEVVLQTALDKSIAVSHSDAEFNFYAYYFSRNDTFIFTTKSLNSDINFKLKIPDKGN